MFSDNYVGVLSPSDVCSSNADCNGGNCVVLEESCSQKCDGDEQDCFDRDNYAPNSDFWNPFTMGNGWYDPPEKLIEDLNCSGTFEDAEEFVDTNGNGKWDAAEIFLDCNVDITVCFGDNGWDAEPDSVKNGEYDLGEPFFDTNGNGIYDLAEDFTDEPRPSCDPFGNGDPITDPSNGTLILETNGVYDEAEPFEDWNDNGKWDSGDIFVSGLIYPWLSNDILDQWDPGNDGYSGDYIRSYPGYKDDGQNGEGLMPNTEYCYFIVAVNSSGVSSYPSETECGYTAMLPSINITTPNGAEIYTKGMPFSVEWEVSDGAYLENIPGDGVVINPGDGNTSYIDKISIEYRIGILIILLVRK